MNESQVLIRDYGKVPAPDRNKIMALVSNKVVI